MISVNASIDGETLIPILYENWTFPAGESGVKFEEKVEYNELAILWNYENDSEIMLLAQLVNALREQNPDIRIDLVVPYLPYSRQDRVCHAGESFSLKVFAGIINGLQFYSVNTLDVHNQDAYFKLFNNSIDIGQHVCASMLPKYDYFIAPDAGAAKKIYMHRQVCQEENPTKVIILDKTRVAGKVVYNALPKEIIPNGSTVCVVDDLCDGGATFEAIADHLAQENVYCKCLDLYVTHGLFTNEQKFKKLYAIYDTIYVSNLVNKSFSNKVRKI